MHNLRPKDRVGLRDFCAMPTARLGDDRLSAGCLGDSLIKIDLLQVESGVLNKSHRPYYS